MRQQVKSRNRGLTRRELVGFLAGIVMLCWGVSSVPGALISNAAWPTDPILVAANNTQDNNERTMYSNRGWFGQSFIPTQTFTLEKVYLDITRPVANAGFELAIWTTTDVFTTSRPPAASYTEFLAPIPLNTGSITAGVVEIALSPAEQILLEAGQGYMLGMRATANEAFTWRSTNYDVYPDGRVYLDLDRPGFDHTLALSGTVIPEPSSAILAMLALPAALLLRRRMRVRS